jgi:D-alanine-D-alanine ligase
MKQAVILINALSPIPTPDEEDVLVQAESVEEALFELGYETKRIFMNLNLEKAAADLRTAKPDLVFNLFESVENTGKFISLAPVLLEHLHIPFTGSDSEQIYITSHKVLTKKFLHEVGLPTAVWTDNPKELNKEMTYIAKPVWEDASVGITNDCIMKGEPETVEKFLRKNNKMQYFFEEYLEGREFNISVLGGNNGPEVLPAAEMLFNNYPPEKPKIMGYEAKWDEDSFEYHNTIRRFGIEQENPELARQLKQICIDCWNLMKLKGYVRVDIRIDAHGNPKILEINANPCISPDAGFYAASEKAGYNYKQMIERILEDVWKLQN